MQTWSSWWTHHVRVPPQQARALAALHGAAATGWLLLGIAHAMIVDLAAAALFAAIAATYLSIGWVGSSHRQAAQDANTERPEDDLGL